MTLSELQEDIIKKVLTIKDVDTLALFKEVLSEKTNQENYVLSTFERQIIEESREDYRRGKTIDHETLFQRNDKWLEE
ncbi:hypothetical protein ACFQZJ_01855 [Maribacter chungangensis]|uniref:Addiction module protein n=1 Tax=Maribacter chungangensis TaxID=1069117 RepID=A0ABW3B0P0_9FLAO